MREFWGGAATLRPFFLGDTRGDTPGDTVSPFTKPELPDPCEHMPSQGCAPSGVFETRLLVFSLPSKTPEVSSALSSWSGQEYS